MSAVVWEFPYRLVRAGLALAPDPDDPQQEEGVLNPAVGVGPDGEWRLFPRMVARGNWSRIGSAALAVGSDGMRVTTLASPILEPDRPWEHGTAHGGVEDPRLTYIPALDVYAMTYVAYGPDGARPALLLSPDMRTWERLGLFEFGDNELGTDLNTFANKDVLWFPDPVDGPDGEPCLALLHRPHLPLDPDGDYDDRAPGPTGPGIWIGYVPLAEARRDVRALLRVNHNRILARPRFAWEALKIGGGPPPVRVPEGWLLLHHGVSAAPEGSRGKGVRYSAGGMILDARDPRRILVRTSEPLLEPSLPEEQVGVVDNVVFPTAIAEAGAERYCFYGMADSAIGLARIEPVSSGPAGSTVPEPEPGS